MGRGKLADVDLFPLEVCERERKKERERRRDKEREREGGEERREKERSMINDSE